MSFASAIHLRANTDPGRSGSEPIALRLRGGAGQPAVEPEGSLGVEFGLVDTLDGLAALGVDWAALFERHGRPGQVFQTHAWCLAWAKSFLADPDHAARHRLFVVTARRDGRLVLVWPLMEDRSAGGSRLVWLGSPVTQYGDVVMDVSAGDATAMLAAAWDFVRERSRAAYVHLAKVREDALVAPFLKKIGAAATVREHAPHLDFADAPDYETYATRKYSKKARKNRTRNERKLGELGSLSIDRLAGGPVAQQTVREALALKRAWLKKTGRISRAIHDPATEAFFVALCAEDVAAEAGSVVTALRVGGALAACEISFVCKGHLVVHVLVYGDTFERFSPGKVLVENAVEACFHHGIERYDLMAPADAYKVAIADRSLEVVDWALPMSISGTLWVRAYLGLVRPGLKRLQAATPVAVRRNLTALVALIGL